jgi:multidrug efflux pump subunit AcrB
MELVDLKALDIIAREVGTENVLISTDYVGVQPPSYPINTIYLFTSGQHEAVLKVALKPQARIKLEDLQERLRGKFKEELPDVSVSFEAGDIINQVMSFGSPTPLQVDAQGPDLAVNRAFAERVAAQLSKVPSLRDLQYLQPLDYPTIQVKIDRDRAGQLGLTMKSVARSLVAATSSSRFTDPNFWRDPRSGNAFQIQVEIPQYQMASVEDIRNLPVMVNGDSRLGGHPLIRDLAQVGNAVTPGEVDRYNMQRVVSLTANIHGKTLGQVAPEVREAIRRAGPPPRGVTINLRGQIPPLEETLSGLGAGLLLSIVIIFLLLAGNFQSLRLSLAVVSAAPAVVCGVAAMLLVTGTTMNVQSFMGAIMSIGISVANAILLITFAEYSRREGAPVLEAALEGGRGRLRAILMTATAMIAGMIPMAFGIGEGSEQATPLGRAVIGGLLVATIATLTVLPAVYAILQRQALKYSPSLHPDDPASRYYENA